MIDKKQITEEAKNAVLNNRKHKLFAIVLCCTLMLSFSISAYAVGTTEYTLDELGMTVFMPSNYIVFTRVSWSRGIVTPVSKVIKQLAF